MRYLNVPIRSFIINNMINDIDVEDIIYAFIELGWEKEEIKLTQENFRERIKEELAKLARQNDLDSEIILIKLCESFIQFYLVNTIDTDRTLLKHLNSLLPQEVYFSERSGRMIYKPHKGEEIEEERLLVTEIESRIRNEEIEKQTKKESKENMGIEKDTKSQDIINDELNKTDDQINDIELDTNKTDSFNFKIEEIKDNLELSFQTQKSQTDLIQEVAELESDNIQNILTAEETTIDSFISEKKEEENQLESQDEIDILREQIKKRISTADV